MLLINILLISKRPLAIICQDSIPLSTEIPIPTVQPVGTGDKMAVHCNLHLKECTLINTLSISALTLQSEFLITIY